MSNNHSCSGFGFCLIHMYLYMMRHMLDLILASLLMTVFLTANKQMRNASQRKTEDLASIELNKLTFNSGAF